MPGRVATGGTVGVGETTGGRGGGGGGGGGAIVGAVGFAASCVLVAVGCTGATGLPVTAVSFAGTGAGSGGLAVGVQTRTGVPHLAQNCAASARPLPHLLQNEGITARAAVAGVAAGSGATAVSERIRT